MAIRTYNDWYHAHKEALAEKIRTEDHSEGEKLTAEVVRYSHLKNHLLAEDHETADIIIACDDDGEPDEFARTGSTLIPGSSRNGRRTLFCRRSISAM